MWRDGFIHFFAAKVRQLSGKTGGFYQPSPILDDHFNL